VKKQDSNDSKSEIDKELDLFTMTLQNMQKIRKESQSNSGN